VQFYVTLTRAGGSLKILNGSLPSFLRGRGQSTREIPRQRRRAQGAVDRLMECSDRRGGDANDRRDWGARQALGCRGPVFDYVNVARGLTPGRRSPLGRSSDTGGSWIRQCCSPESAADLTCF
jgi:hypothetical protein